MGNIPLFFFFWLLLLLFLHQPKIVEQKIEQIIEGRLLCLPNVCSHICFAALSQCKKKQNRMAFVTSNTASLCLCVYMSNFLLCENGIIICYRWTRRSPLKLLCSQTFVARLLLCGVNVATFTFFSSHLRRWWTEDTSPRSKNRVQGHIMNLNL